MLKALPTGEAFSILISGSGPPSNAQRDVFRAPKEKCFAPKEKRFALKDTRYTLKETLRLEQAFTNKVKERFDFKQHD
ncbi:hypothetical protein [Sporosarcina sp. ACRSL]|uniref:hypothetical protein n=1 Tax=Sporosarcina sp. ACRSL TaxID=2918215 RepID=UPI001EF69915|nr:hypothetical protein [Sporosarcina sp. ACRSL]